MDYVSGLLDSIGGHNYHKIWVTYFTKPFQPVFSDIGHSTAVDNFILSFKYQPLSLKEVSNALKKKPEDEDVSLFLSKLLHFDETPFLNHLIFFHSWFESNTEINRSGNRNYIEDFYIRSFIIISYNLHSIVNEALINKNTGAVLDIIWNLLTEVISIILCLQHLPVSDISLLLQYFFEAFSDLQPVFQLNISNPIRQSIIQIGSILIPYCQTEFCAQRTYTLIFLRIILHEWTKVFQKDESIDSFVTYTSAFLNMALSVLPSFQEDDFNFIISDISTILQYLIAGKLNSLTYLQLLLPSFKFLTSSVDYIKQVKEILSVVNDLLILSLTQFTNIMIDILPEEDYIDCTAEKALEYFNNNNITRNGCIILDSKHAMIIKEMTNYLHHLDDPQEIIADSITAIHSSEENLRMQRCLIFILALTQVKTKSFLQIDTFLNALPLNQIFPPDFITTPIVRQCQCAFLHLLYIYTFNNPNQLELMFDFISFFITGSYFYRATYLIPLFRAFVLDDNLIFMDSRVFLEIEDNMTKSKNKSIELDKSIENKIAIFLASVCMKCSDKMFIKSSNTFMLTILILLSADYGQFYQPIIEHFFEIVNLHNCDEEPDYLTILLNHVSFILGQIGFDTKLIKVGASIANSLYHGLHTVKGNISNIIANSQVLKIIVQTTVAFHSSAFFKALILIIAYISNRYNNFINKTYPKFWKTLKNALPLDVVDQELIEIIESYIYIKVISDQQQTLKINEPAAISLLLSLCENSKFEDSVLSNIYEACVSNVTNAYTCFTNDLLNDLLERLSKSVHPKAIQIFTTIASQFFSPMVMRSIIKTLRNTKNYVLRNEMANCLLDFVSRSDKFPASSFFHFSGNESIICPKISGGIFTLPFAISFAFRITKRSLNRRNPLVAVAAVSSDYISIFIDKDGIMKINLTKSGKIINFAIAPIKISRWHVIYARFSPQNINVLLDGTFYKLEVGIQKLDDNQNIFIGAFNTDNYYGDIGPVFITKVEKFQTTISQVNEAMQISEVPANNIMSFLPINAKGSEMIVSSKTMKIARITADPIPFVATFVDVMKFDSIFPLTIPLLLLFGGKDSDAYLRSLFGLFVSMITKEEKMEEFFRQIGGFRLFASIMKYTPNEFTYDIVHDIVALFNHVSDESKRDLAKYVILNYDIWRGKDFEFQKCLFGEAIPQLIDQFPEYFTVLTTEELMIQTIQTTNSTQNEFLSLDEKLFELDMSIMGDFAQELELSKSTNFENEFGSVLVKMKWNILTKISLLQQIETTFLYFYLVSFYYNEKFTKSLAKEALIKILSQSDDISSLIHCMHPLDAVIKELKENPEASDQVLTILSYYIMDCPDIDLKNCIELLLSLINENNATKFMEFASLLYCAHAKSEEFCDMIIIIMECLRYDIKITETTKHQMIESFLDKKAIEKLVNYPHFYTLLGVFVTKMKIGNEFLIPIMLSSLQADSEGDFKYFFEMVGNKQMDELCSTLLTQTIYIPVLTFVCSYIGYRNCECLSVMESAIKPFERFIKYDPNSHLTFGPNKVHTFIAFANIAGEICKKIPEKMIEVEQIFSTLIVYMPDNVPIQLAQLLFHKFEPYLFSFTINYSARFEFLSHESQKKCEIESTTLYNVIAAYTQNVVNDKHRSLKLFTSFVRSITSDGGAWSSNLPIHWRASTKLDNLLRPIFARRNMNFCDHKNTGNKVEENNEQEVEKVSKVLLSFQNDIKDSISAFPAKERCLSGFYDGYIHIVPDALAFDGILTADSFGIEQNDKKKSKFKSIQFSDITFVFRRFFMHDDCGIEIYTRNWHSSIFYFPNQSERDNFLEKIKPNLSKFKFGEKHIFYRFASACYDSCIQDCDADILLNRSRICDAWTKGKLTNFEYLSLLNIISGRSFNDISQYPVFPWVISNYKTNKFDLTDITFFRDFSKPIGAISQERLESLYSIRKNVDDLNEKCLYRSNMSNPSTVCGFMIREEPFTSMHIRLQDGCFDKANRLFFSIESCWNSVNNSISDYRELIPQFFTNPRFLTNSNKFVFGKRTNGKMIDDVELPPWCNSPYDFVDKNAIALESNYVTSHLNEWIDLVFGCYQRDIDHHNEFHLYSYHECMDMGGSELKMLKQSHCANFGCLPTKIFKSKSPKKSFGLPPKIPEIPLLQSTVVALTHNICVCEDGTVMKLSKKMPRIKIPAKFSEQMLYAVCQKPLTLFVTTPHSTFITAFMFSRPSNPMRLIHSSSGVLCCAGVDNKLIVGGSDCFIYIWSWNENLTNITLESTMQIHAATICSIATSKHLGIFVSIDTNHKVYVVSIADKQVISSFNAKCVDGTILHKIALADNGRIVISSESEQLSTQVTIYDMCGNLVNQSNFNCEVVKLRTGFLRSSEFLILITLGAKRLEFFTEKSDGSDWLKTQDAKKLWEDFDPNFLAIGEKERTLWYVTRTGTLNRVLI